ncbi:beta-TrCP-like [Physella acuta]|uniref:beta-TrCP-like n=1 Tax=Physella acuta TaxID=109671 RepID=UPI0027DD30EC|nr:beta-TrCP-like [Physella acuta]
MCESNVDPHFVGCISQHGKPPELLNSSTSVSDLSEAASDMSLSTSPGSDIPSQSQSLKDFVPTSTSIVDGSKTSQQLKKRVVVRQLSSNPYLTSSEMSSSEEHPVVKGSHSYAAGESRLYSGNNESYPDYCLSELVNRELPQKANSYPLTSNCFWESDEDDDNDNGNDDIQKRVNSVILDNNHPKTTDCNNISDEKITFPNHKQNEQTDISLANVSSAQLRNPQKLNANIHNERGEIPEDQRHYHYSHQMQHHQQQHYTNANSLPKKDSIINTSSKKLNGLKWCNNQNEINGENCSVTSKQYTEDSQGPPKSQNINSWGHFYKPSAESHYKYRRSHYSSDSDEEDSPTANSEESTNRNSISKAPGKFNYQDKVSSQSYMHKNNHSTIAQSRVSEKKSWSQNGMKPIEFKERFQLIKKWFFECNDGQKNIVLKGLLHMCQLPQLHLLSVHMSKELHHGCPSNCEDIITWLPSSLATKVISYLDPVSLCRSAQVCKVWRQIAEDQSLWRRFCCQTKWRLSKAAEHKQVISHMSPEGSIQWKNVFAERFRLRNNWLKGRCTVRTFEGHLQGISCVQFDDSRIVSGSSDKTIKVWNMRTNAPWSVQTLMGHHGTVRCLHLEGNRLVSGSCDKTIKVWDLSTQESWSSIACKVTMTGHLDTVRCLQADDDKVISGSYDKTLKIWDLKSGNLRTTLRGHQASVLCVHFSETKIVSGSADKTINVWNHEGRCMMTLRGHQDAVTCLMFDSTRIVSGSLDHNLKFWDIHTGKCLNTIDWKEAEGHTDVVRCLQADSWRVVSAADDKTIKVWNLATGERLVTLRNHTDGVTCLQFNDFIIVSGSYDKTVKLWDFSCC